MSKVIMFNMVSLDGFFEGLDHSLEWHSVNDEFNTFAIEQLDTAGALVFGRVTYDMMASYWPSPAGIEGDPQIAERMNRLPKIVFSRTLDRADWNNTRLVSGDAAGEVSKLRQEQGGNLLLFGSADLAAALIDAGLIDEFRLMVNPIVLGAGTPLFKEGHHLDLKLLSARTFGNGNVLLTYERA